MDKRNWVALFLGVNALLISVSNWRVIVRHALYGETASTFAFVGALLGVAALFMQSNTILWEYWWVTLIVDGSCIPAYLHTAYCYLRRR